MTTEELQCPFYPMQRSAFAPPAELEELQAREPVTRVRIWDGSEHWLVTRFDDARAVLSSPDISSDIDLPNFPHASENAKLRKARTKTLNHLDNPVHDNVRRFVTRDFMLKRAEALRPAIQTFVDGAIDAMLAGPKPVDLIDVFALPLPTYIICELLGVKYSDRGEFHQLIKTMTGGRSTTEEVQQSTTDVKQFMMNLIDEKIAEPTGDMIGRLVQEQLNAGSISYDDLVNLCLLLLVAGHETTGNMIALGTVALLQRPELVAELRESDDPALFASTVEELLRWLNILHLGRRRVALADMEIGGVSIRAGEGIIVAQEIANRDPEMFENPTELDIHRDARQHIAFGYGIHQCLGQQLARVELQVVFGTLFRRIPTLRLAESVDSLNFDSGRIVYAVEAVPVTW